MQNVSSRFDDIPSDALSQLRDLISRGHQLNSLHGVPFPIEMPLQLQIVIDTNGILRELHWLLRAREKPAARTALQEVLDSGTVVAFVPRQLPEEVAEKIPEFAKKRRIDEGLLLQEWQSYQKRLHVCSINFDIDSIQEINSRPVVDRDDLPFVILTQEVGAVAILSYDSHMLAMGANTIGEEVVKQLRRYTRAKSIELTIRVGGY